MSKKEMFQINKQIKGGRNLTSIFDFFGVRTVRLANSQL